MMSYLSRFWFKAPACESAIFPAPTKRQRYTPAAVLLRPGRKSQEALILRLFMSGRPQTGQSVIAHLRKYGIQVNDVGHRINGVRRSCREVGVTLRGEPIKLARGKRCKQYHLTKEGIARLEKLRENLRDE